jgi:spermidine synthase
LVHRKHTPNVRLSIRTDRQLYGARSAFQRIDIFESLEFGRFLALDGYMMLTEKDEFIYHEMITHVPMAVHPAARRILVIGGGDGGAVRELTRYACVESIDLVEIDPMVVEACREYLPFTACKLDDPRVHIHYEDGVKFVRRREAVYDLIIVDSTDPFGPGEGLFTREFYGSCYMALKDDGIMVNQHESPFYPNDAAAMQRAHKRIVESFPDQPRLSGPHTHLSLRALAVRLCLKKIPPFGRPALGRMEQAGHSNQLLHHQAARGLLLYTGLCGKDASRCGIGARTPF